MPTLAQAQTPMHLTLAESLLRAQKYNESLLIAQQDLATAKQQVREATADALPQLDATLNYTRNWILPTFIFGGEKFAIGAHNNLTGSIGIRQTIYSGGKTFAALHIARLFKSYSEEALRMTRQQVHKSVEAAFYDLLLAQDLLHVSQLVLSRAQTNLLRVQKLYQAGRVSEYDLLRAQTQEAEVLPDTIRAANHLTLAALTFKNSIGMPTNTPTQIEGTFRKTSPLIAKSQEELIAQGLQSRPKVRQLNLQVHMQKKAETLSKANARPTLDVLVNGQWEAQKNSFGFAANDFQQSWFSGINLRIPIFDGFRTHSQVAQAKAATQRAELSRQQTERTIGLEIAQAHAQLGEALARKIAQQKTVDLAQRGLRIAESRYESGIGTQLEVIDSQLALQRAETELAQVKRDLAIAIVTLEHSVGILGETP